MTAVDVKRSHHFYQQRSLSQPYSPGLPHVSDLGLILPSLIWVNVYFPNFLICSDADVLGPNDDEKDGDGNDDVDNDKEEEEKEEEE